MQKPKHESVSAFLIFGGLFGGGHTPKVGIELSVRLRVTIVS
ncbi:hypothetical protein [Shewanella halifaxensis]|nr:hypothetical protein [Shewanella halifaxensis]